MADAAALTLPGSPGTVQYMVRAEKDPLSQLRRGVVEYCVLASLREAERYGFELVQALGGSNVVLIAEGTIYPLLARLRREGSVETTWRESTTGPPRRYYRLTQNGHDALREFTDEWADFRDAVDRLLTKGSPK
jgi:PadR family transcriptional regulator PadR